MIVPKNGMKIAETVVLQPGTYHLPGGLEIIADGVAVFGEGVTLVGGGEGRGLVIEGMRGVRIEGISFAGYRQSVWASDCRDLVIESCSVEPRLEEEERDTFLEIWSGPERYSSGILLQGVVNAWVTNCDLSGQTVGLSMFNCKAVRAYGNKANNCSAWGMLLHRTTDGMFKGNQMDHCYRESVFANGGKHHGGDAAGVLLVKGSSRNFFATNSVKYGGDGFFLAGLDPQYVLEPCHSNIFANNDVSGATHNGFEASFCQNNHFVRNLVVDCHYGFWLGFSSFNRLLNNQISSCWGAGVAVENGRGFLVEDNRFSGNHYGILLWSMPNEKLIAAVPENMTSYNWRVIRNQFIRNKTAVRIAANQSHGVRQLPAADFCPRPHDHKLERNSFVDNEIEVQLIGAS